MHHLRFLGRLIQLVRRILFGADIDAMAHISLRAIIPHTGGVVIGETAVIEEWVVMMPNVVLDSK